MRKNASKKKQSEFETQTMTGWIWACEYDSLFYQTSYKTRGIDPTIATSKAYLKKCDEYKEKHEHKYLGRKCRPIQIELVAREMKK